MTAILPSGIEAIKGPSFEMAQDSLPIPDPEIGRMGHLATAGSLVETAPAELRHSLGHNAGGAAIEVARIPDPRDTRIIFRRGGQTQATRGYTIDNRRMPEYRGPQISSQEVDHRRTRNVL